jgi:hypothetical protein
MTGGTTAPTTMGLLMYMLSNFISMLERWILQGHSLAGKHKGVQGLGWSTRFRVRRRGHYSTDSEGCSVNAKQFQC